MKQLLPLVAALTCAAAPLSAQRRVRVGPTASTIAIDEGSTSRSYTSFGAVIALLTGDDAETGLTVSRYPDLSNGACELALTFVGLDSYYYPVGARGVAPFASSQVGLARVSESRVPLLGSCPGTVETTSELGLGFGLGVRVGAGDAVVAVVEGRFFQVLPRQLQGLEARATVSVAFGPPRQSELLRGTLGPALSFLIPVSGPLEGRGPFFGVRFRRDTKKSSTVGLQIDYAAFKVTESCTPPGCKPHAVLFAPGYEASLHPRWGRFYGELGLLIAGFPEVGPDRGLAQGAHGGIGFDIYAGERAMVNLNARLLWLQRATGSNVFGLQVGASVSPKLVHPKAP
ncbi:MAG: hypothetical protein ACREL9_10180 [Gemmatimonadales bacterium]